MNFQDSTNGVSMIAIIELGWRLDQLNWQEVVKLLRDIFAYAYVEIVVYTLEEKRVHAMSAEGDAEIYVDGEIEGDSEDLFWEIMGSKQNSLRNPNPANLLLTIKSQSSTKKFTVIASLSTTCNTNPKYYEQRILRRRLSVLGHCRWRIDPPDWYVSWCTRCLLSTAIRLEQNYSRVPRHTAIKCGPEKAPF